MRAVQADKRLVNVDTPINVFLISEPAVGAGTGRSAMIRLLNRNAAFHADAKGVSPAIVDPRTPLTVKTSLTPEGAKWLDWPPGRGYAAKQEKNQR